MRHLRAVPIGLAAVVVATAVAPAEPATAAPGDAAARIPQKPCFWSGEVDSKFDRSPAKNYAFPDSGAVYWTAHVTMPAGSKIVLKGKLPHARYESLNTYDAATHAPTDALNDVSTVPDKGSTNPFRVGADRRVAKRSYTAIVLNESAPASRAANTFYAGVPGQTDQMIMYRVSEPDAFDSPAELTGGVGLPTPSCTGRRERPHRPGGV